ncbi:MAG: hypothetical protein ACRENH_01060 [Gemmatimonadaceae bacterium]
MTRALVLGGAMTLASVPLSAQSWQTLSVERAKLPTSELSVVVRHHAGKFSIKPTGDSVGFRAKLRYDARALEPIYSYNADSGALRLGTRERQGGSGRRASDLDITLGTTGRLAIDVQASAAETQLDLTELPITALTVSSGASDTRVRFDRPNPVRMKNLTLSTGAASIVVDGLGNANAEEIVVRASVGEVHLDLAGSWQGDTELRAEVTLGTLTIHVPMDLGVHVEVSRVLAGFSNEGLTRRGAAYVSDNWDTAARKVRIYAQTVVGFLTVQRR